MEFYILIFVLCLVCVAHDVHVQAKSIDEIFSKVEDDYRKKLENDNVTHSVRPEWNEYSLPNRSESLVKLQHDMIITKEMYQEIINRTEELPQNKSEKRNATNEKIRLWSTKRISYQISDGFTAEHKLKILEAMNHWEQYTCLKFVKAQVTDIDVIVFTPKEGVCESFVGRMGGFQPIGLDLQCMTKSVLIHEIGHAIGFFHEHMRADRDQYLIVNYKNIDESKHSQFDPLKGDGHQDFNKPYDYYSIMHYGKLSFSIDKEAGLVTMKPKNLTFLDIIGNSPSLSYHDMIIANDLYSCSADCPENTCVDGFVGGSNCECFCRYDNEFDVRICGRQACKASELTDYDVYDENNKKLNVTTNGSFLHGTHLYVNYPQDQNCGNQKANYTCENGQWKGELSPCIPVDPREACVLNYDVNKYVIHYDGAVANNSDEIPSDKEVNVSCLHNEGNDEQPRTLGCFNGKWEYDVNEIECAVQKVCPMVVNTAFTGSYENGFRVECIPTHALVTDGQVPGLFSCNRDGQWQPFTPICDPKNCTVPADRVERFITDTNGVGLNPGDIVAHGTEVNIRCPKSYVPVHKSYKCSYGAYDTPDGNIPNCKQEPCVLNYDVDKYVIHYDGDVANNGDEIPSDKEVSVSCLHNEGNDEIPRTLGCFNGKWEYNVNTIECAVRSACPMVVNAAITGSYENGFKVECIPRHALVTDGKVPDLFYCNKDGLWQPFTPECDPKNCSVPADKVKMYITDTNGDNLIPGDIVAHGTKVNVRCAKSYVPVYESYVCSYGAYATEDGNLPNCRQVTCNQPPVINTEYSPRKDTYLFGDEIKLRRCRGKTYLEGDKSLTCTQQGTWSGRAECVTFCPSNTDGYEKHKNAIIMPAAVKKSYSTKVITHSYCQDLCTDSWKDRKGRFRGQLCGGYGFGYNGRYYECTLYYQRPQDLIELKEYKPIMTLGIRICL